MAMTINNNVSALKAQRSLSLTNRGLSSSIEKLSSGFRINTGADDPSGLVISEQLRSQIAGLERAVRNSNEAYNLIGIAEGALNEMNEILKNLRALAIHSANSGITSPEQVEADQAELDAGIQTIQRIANTTKYSDQLLLNGSKQLVYDINTVVNDPMDHALLDNTATRVDQVFKRDGMVMTIGHTGYLNDSQANSETSAQRAYLEADNAYGLCQIDGNSVTAVQKFILTGSAGSKQFSFDAGASLGLIVSTINNSADSTGVSATLIFASDTRIDKTTNGAVTGPDYTTTPPTPGTGISTYDTGYVYEAGDVQIYGADYNNPDESKISDFLLTPSAAESFIVGNNCDGDGKIYAKVVDVATGLIEYYKDADCTMLIGTGDGSYFSPASNSGIPGAPTQSLDGIFITLTGNAENLDVFEIALVGQNMDNMKDMDVEINGWSDVANSVMSGVNLGVNTSVDGDLYFRYVPVNVNSNGDVTDFRVEVYKDASYDPQYLVASSGTVSVQPTMPQTITIEAENNSNLNITMNIPSPAQSAFPTVEQTGAVSFTNLGVRLYANEYGSQESIRIQNQEGELFYYYRENNNLDRIMITGTDTVQLYGQDARINVNGTSVYTNGLTAKVTTTDFSGVLAFNSGGLGLTTIAVAGYEYGSLYSKAQALQAIEENEDTIARDQRTFVPPSLTLTLPGLVDKTGAQVNLYLDFTCLDSSILEEITNLNTSAAIAAEYFPGSPAEIHINASALGITNTLQLTVDPDKLESGFFITGSDLKGLYVRTDARIDTNTSTNGSVTDNVIATPGDRMLNVMTYATNPRTNTSETLSNFLGGMQFQLGNSSGDQDRTVYSIQSMDIANLGRIEYNGESYCLEDILGGGSADLSRDPILAMKIIEKAVDDVSTLRSRLGAFQANMLQTNINSLEVAIENLTLTESAIRDTDMAAESTEYTKNQIMVQASTSMLAQANVMSQNVLSLLQ